MPLAAAFAIAVATRAARDPGAQDTPRTRQPDRGREADRPGEIPPEGWRDILRRVKAAMAADHLSTFAAGVAFYGILAICPALAGVISIYGLIADTPDVERHLAMAAGLMPEDARAIMTDQLAEVARQSHVRLGLGAIAALLFALWSAVSAVRTLMTGLNVAYDEPETRGFVRLYASALLLTLSGIFGTIMNFSLMTALPAGLRLLALRPALETALSLLRWPLLAGVVMVGLALLYRFAPSREQPRWQWVSWGAAGAAALWLCGSLLFTWYVAHFGEYNVTYGALGAAALLLLWSYFGAYAALLGAEVNAEMERQTARDTTERRGAPLGARGADAADTVGASP